MARIAENSQLMHAWEFAEALHLQGRHGWARFVSVQDHYNLLVREEEREMIPLCLDEGVGTVAWSPLVRGRLACPWEAAKSTTRAETDGGYADLLYTPLTADSDHAVASLDIELTAEELAALERPYTPRYDFQGISDEAEMQKIRDQIPGYANA